MADQFSLRWNDFYANLSSSFHALYEESDLVDVTLAAEGRNIKAHKLILSVCSPYFKELFKINPCPHPVVILKDVQYEELKNILQFMYKGEVKVKQQELTSFLHTAEMLQVKGLTVGRDKSPSPPPPDDVVHRYALPAILPMEENNKNDWGPQDENINDPYILDEEGKSPLKRLLTNSTKQHVQKKKANKYTAEAKNFTADPKHFAADPKHFTADPKHFAADPKQFPFETKNFSADTPQDLPEYISDNDQMTDCDGEMYHNVLDIPENKDMTKQDGWNCKIGGVKCPSCHRFFANRYNLKVHIRDKHDTLEGTLQCEICHKTMRNPSCLRVHMYHHRKQAAFQAAQLIPSIFPNNDMDVSSPTNMLNSIQKCHQEMSSSPPQIECGNTNHVSAGNPIGKKEDHNETV